MDVPCCWATATLTVVVVLLGALMLQSYKARGALVRALAETVTATESGQHPIPLEVVRIMA